MARRARVHRAGVLGRHALVVDEFLRTLQAYDRILDDKTTVFLPADAEVLRMLHFEVQPTAGEPLPGAAAPVGAAGPPQGPNGLSADADRLLKKKSGEELR